MEELQRLLGELLLQFLLVVAASVAALRWLAKRYVDHRLEKELQAFRHEHDKELERLKFEITSLFSRVSKIHEKEFEILPEAWFRLQKALGAAAHLASALIKYPKLDEMSQAHFEAFVESADLLEFQKAELRKADNRVQYYLEQVFWRDFGRAETAHAELHNYLADQRIFLTKNLHGRFLELAQAIRKALNSVEIGHQHDGKLIGEAASSINSLTPKVEELGNLVQERLHYEDAL